MRIEGTYYEDGRDREYEQRAGVWYVRAVGETTWRVSHRAPADPKATSTNEGGREA